MVLALAAAGCGGNVDVPRGFGSREVLPVRDPSIALNYVADVLGQNPTLIYSTEGDDGGAATYWTLDLVTGELQNAGNTAPAIGAGTASSRRYLCQTQDISSGGTESLEITDTTTGTKTVITGVSGFSDCPQDDGTIALLRTDPDTGKKILWTGLFQALAPVSLPVDIDSVALFPDDGKGSPPSTVVVFGSPPAQPDSLGLYAIDLGSSAVTEVVPPTPTNAVWAPGAAPAGSLESSSLAPNVDVLPFNDHYIYGRSMSDGGTALFVGPFPSGPASEMALFQVSTDRISNLPPGVRVGPPDDVAERPPLPQMISWQLDGADDAASTLMVWDDANSQLTACPSVPGAFESGVLSPDGSHVLFKALQLGGQIAFAPLQLLSLAPGEPHTCVQLDDDTVTWADFSGEASTIAWISKPDMGSISQLWTANGDGSDKKKILSGQLAARFITGTAHLEMAYGGDLVWLDVRNPNQFSYVAEKLFGYPTNVGGAWFVAGYDYSSQDASGQLGAVDLDSGHKRSISPAVAQYLVSPQVMPDPSSAFGESRTGLSHVVYLVRGRNPSSQDGIWVATVQAADLQ
ncbi:MAG TPA: hypothetical protein VN962_18275 [Polyangia bacterium]|nr:hypothetical protein [Polyangia bacterium]